MARRACRCLKARRGMGGLHRQFTEVIHATVGRVVRGRQAATAKEKRRVGERAPLAPPPPQEQDQ
eukprot:366101-Chlamydomonas_euryale.AAC.3